MHKENINTKYILLFFSMLLIGYFTISLFISNDINYGWDGTHNGKKFNSGVFVFTLFASFFDGENKEIKGTITLLQ